MDVDVRTQGRHSSQQHESRADGHTVKDMMDWGIHISEDSVPTCRQSTYGNGCFEQQQRVSNGPVVEQQLSTWRQNRGDA